MSSTLDRATLKAAPTRLLSRARNWTKADVYAFDHAGREVVIKDFAARPWLARQTLGRWFAGREARVYGALDGVVGVPRYLGRPDPFCFAIEKIEGTRLREMKRRTVDPALFDRLGETLREIHRRGVALSDLHHRNVLVTAEGPFLLDLAMGVRRRGGAHLLARLLYRIFRRLDRVALLRMKRRYVGRLSAEEESFLTEHGGIHRLGRRLKSVLDAARLGRHAEKPR